ncbi:PGTB2 [Enterospora canceri]|uniref:Geranylgeranyl transferase type II subunit beta n=1 Tax=Enterospora canceri TaxID=1081671 RepID=A0A1Y1S7I0_9MICR|nr:PGTB2 [Enterospora canceri]
MKQLAVEDERHVQFVIDAMNTRDIYYHILECKKISNLYRMINSLRILKSSKFDYVKRKALELVKDCYTSSGGFAPEKTYPPNVSSTRAALQVLHICESDAYYKKEFDRAKTAKFLMNLQTGSGGFANDEFGDVDTRVDCCAISSLKMLELLEKNDFRRESLEVPLDLKKYPEIDSNGLVRHILRCYDTGGGFGQVEGAEGHAAQTFCCISTLKILGLLNTVDLDDVTAFIAQNQHENGGLMGRVNKKPDSCYSFWSYATLKMTGGEDSIDKKKLIEFIRSCEHEEGGFSDQPGNVPDIYHQMFSLAALVMLGVIDGELSPSMCI